MCFLFTKISIIVLLCTTHVVVSFHPLSKHVRVVDPLASYPGLQVIVAVSSRVVPVGVLALPLVGVGSPQSCNIRADNKLSCEFNEI